jgi:hypothetical protein
VKLLASRPTPQPGGPEYPFLSGSSPLTYLAWETLCQHSSRDHLTTQAPPLRQSRGDNVIFMDFRGIKLGEALDVGWLATYVTPSWEVRSSMMSFGLFCDSRIATLLFHQYPLLWKAYFTSCWLSNMTDGSSATSCFCDPAVHTCLHYSWQPRGRLSSAAELPELRTLTNQIKLNNRTIRTNSYQHY